MTSGSVSSPSGGSWSLIIWWCRVSLLLTAVQLFPIDVARPLNCGVVVRVCGCFCSIWHSAAIAGSWVCFVDFKFSSTVLGEDENGRNKLVCCIENWGLDIWIIAIAISISIRRWKCENRCAQTCWPASGTPLPIQCKRWQIKWQRLASDPPAPVILECLSNSIDLKWDKRYCERLERERERGEIYE